MKKLAKNRYCKLMVGTLLCLSVLMFCFQENTYEIGERRHWPLTQLILGLNNPSAQNLTGDKVVQRVGGTLSDTNNEVERTSSDNKRIVKNENEKYQPIYDKADVLKWPESSAPENSVRQLLRKELDQIYLHNSDFYRHRDERSKLSGKPFPDSATKNILYYNDVYKAKDFDFGEGNTPFLKSGCPYHNCFVTSNRSLIPENSADAIIWFTNGFDNQLPSNMSSETRLVLFLLESPVHTSSLTKYNDKFNYTMGYVTNSDIPLPYGIFTRKIKVPSQKQRKNYAEGKTGMAVSFSSNCNPPSKREL